MLPKVTPNQDESPFDFHEFFFSTTNVNGIIRYGNDVFIRVSNYPKEQIIGAPHNIIRHPDVPRAVFKVFWDMLKSEKAIGAYVKNLAANGNYYWVFAFAFPIENGYLSIRFKPSSDVFKVVQNVYSDVKEFEVKNKDLTASEKFLIEKIQSQGFQNYEDFMIKAVVSELRSRLLKTKNFSSHEVENGTNHRKTIADYSQKTLATLTEMFEWTKIFQKANNGIAETVKLLDQGFRNLKFISINMTLTAAKFGKNATSLVIVSKEFSDLSKEIETQLKIFDDFADKLSKAIEQCTFRISALNVQMLMVDFFVKEALQRMDLSDSAFAEMNENERDFSILFHQYATKMGEEVSSLILDISDIEKIIEEVKRLITGLEVIRQIGGIEASRVSEIKKVFNQYMDDMNNFVSLLRKSNANVSTEIDELKLRCKMIVNSAGKIADDVRRIFELAAKTNSKM